MIFLVLAGLVFIAAWYLFPRTIPNIPCGLSRWPLPLQRCILLPPIYPLYQVPYYGERPRLVVTHPDIVKQVYKHESTLMRPSDFGMNYILREVLGECLFVKYGDDYHRVLRAFKRRYTPGHVLEKVDLAANICTRWARGLVAGDAQAREGDAQLVADDTQARAGEAQTREITCADLLEVPFEVVARVMYGERLDAGTMAELKEFCEEMDHLTGEVFANKLAGLPGYQYLPTPLRARLRRFQDTWRAFNRRMLESSKTDPSGVLHEIATSGVLEGKDGIRFQEVCDTFNEIVLANADFVAAAVAWPLVHLSRYPEAAQRVRDEMRDVLRGAQPTTETIRQLTYLDMVLKESWRMEPMLVITNPIIIGEEGVEISGVKVPKGTPIVFDTKAINRNASAWKDPDTFRPERFDSEHEKEIDRHALHIFGLGTRRCLGQYYASMICKCMLVAIMQNYEVQVIEEDNKPGYGPFQFPPAHFKLIKK